MENLKENVVEFANGTIVEHICKESTSGYPHDKKYSVVGQVRMKDPTTREWIDGICYSNGEEYFVREKNDFYNKFKPSKV